MARKRIGDYPKDKGILNAVDVERIIDYSTRTGLRFGEAGMELGLLTPERMIEVFGPSYRVDFFSVQPEYFPTQTREWFAPAFLLRWGVLPLGTKAAGGFLRRAKTLNLGLLDPSAKALDQLEPLVLERARERDDDIQGIRCYLVLPESFLDVMSGIYGVGAAEMRRVADAGEMHPRAIEFLPEGDAS